MALSEIIRPGDKIDISRMQQVNAMDEDNESFKVYKSQVLNLKENGNLEISMPSEGGKLILLTLGVRYEFIFFSRGGLYRAIGQIVERYKSENVYMLEIQLKSQIEKYLRREFFRYPCILDMTYYTISDEEAKVESGDEIFDLIRESGDCARRAFQGRIVELSGGGIRFATTREAESGEYMLFQIGLQNKSFHKQYAVIGRVSSCLEREQEPDQLFEVHIKFLITDNNVREEIIRFIFEEERSGHQRGK